VQFLWRQPHTPFFRELTPLLRGLGRLPGEEYQDRPNEDTLVIMSKLSPRNFVTRKLFGLAGLAREQAQVVSYCPSEVVEGLVEGSSRSAACIGVAGQSLAGPVSAEYLIATADLPITEGSFRWAAAYLAWWGPQELAWVARNALATVLATAEPTGPGEARSGIARMIDSACTAFSITETACTSHFISLLSGAFRPQAAGPVRLPSTLWAYWSGSQAALPSSTE